MRIALELALHDRVYEDIATKFFEHFLYIAKAMSNIGGDRHIGLWNEEDQFFYDVLRFPDGKMIPLKVRSMIGLIPFYAVEIYWISCRILNAACNGSLITVPIWLH